MPSLEALLEAGFEVPLVVTQPDRPVGRRHGEATAVGGRRARRRSRDSDVKPEKVRGDAEFLDRLASGRGRTRSPSSRTAGSFPAEVLAAAAPRLRVNVHASLSSAAPRRLADPGGDPRRRHARRRSPRCAWSRSSTPGRSISSGAPRSGRARRRASSPRAWLRSAASFSSRRCGVSRREASSARPQDGRAHVLPHDPARGRRADWTLDASTLDRGAARVHAVAGSLHHARHRAGQDPRGGAVGARRGRRGGRQPTPVIRPEPSTAKARISSSPSAGGSRPPHPAPAASRPQAGERHPVRGRGAIAGSLRSMTRREIAAAPGRADDPVARRRRHEPAAAADGAKGSAPPTRATKSGRGNPPRPRGRPSRRARGRRARARPRASRRRPAARAAPRRAALEVRARRGDRRGQPRAAAEARAEPARDPGGRALPAAPPRPRARRTPPSARRSTTRATAAARAPRGSSTASCAASCCCRRPRLRQSGGDRRRSVRLEARGLLLASALPRRAVARALRSGRDAPHPRGRQRAAAPRPPRRAARRNARGRPGGARPGGRRDRGVAAACPVP